MTDERFARNSSMRKCKQQNQKTAEISHADHLSWWQERAGFAVTDHFISSRLHYLGYVPRVNRGAIHRARKAWSAPGEQKADGVLEVKDTSHNS